MDNMKKILFALAALLSLAACSSNEPALATDGKAIVVCGDMSKALEGDARSFWVQDCSAATENILLAAHALGLGAVWTGLYPNMERVNAVSEVLNLTDNIIPLCTVVIGYPAEQPQPKDKWNPDNVSYNECGGKAE